MAEEDEPPKAEEDRLAEVDAPPAYAAEFEAEENDESVDSARALDDDVVRKQKLAKLSEYVEHFAYRLPKQKKPPKFAYEFPKKKQKPNEYLDKLSTGRRLIIETHLRHHDDLSPIGRAKRVRETYEKYSGFTTEQMEAHLKTIRQTEIKTKKLQAARDKKFQQTKIKLEKQCRDQILLKIVTKFAKLLAHKSATYKPPPVATESFKRLQRSLMCNLHLALGITSTPYTPQYAIYDSLSSVLAEIILQAFFKAQAKYRKVDGKCATAQFDDILDTEEACINERAKRAAKKEERRNAPKAGNPDFERLLKLLNGICECEDAKAKLKKL